MPPLVLDGTNGVSGVDGTASNPAIEGTDSNTGIFYPAADTVAIGTGGTEALRVNSSQQVGIGTNSPGSILAVSAASPTITLTATTTTGTTIGNKNNRLLLTAASVTVNNGGEVVFGIADTNTGRWGAISGAIQTNSSGGATGDILFATKSSDAATSLSERARITSTGEFELQSTTANGAYVRSAANFTLASNATLNITNSVAGAPLILIYNVSDGAGAVFFANYLSNSVKIAGDGAATDTGTTFAVYKNASSHVTTIRNRYATSQTFRIAVYSAQAQP